MNPMQQLSQNLSPLGTYLGHLPQLPQAIRLQAPVTFNPASLQQQARPTPKGTRPFLGVNDLTYGDWLVIVGDPLHAALLSRTYYHPTPPDLFERSAGAADVAE